LIESRRVFIDGREARKSSQPVPEAAELVVLEAIDYVSRAGHKLAAALEEFTDIEIVGKICLDVGASTGGFTDVLLRYGASKVIALDVGHSQLSESLVDNRMVINIENFNARDMTQENLQKVLGSRLDQKLNDNIAKREAEDDSDASEEETFETPKKPKTKTVVKDATSSSPNVDAALRRGSETAGKNGGSLPLRSPIPSDRKIKEHNSILVPDYPKITDMISWQARLMNAVVVASVLFFALA
jgi:hypothetical protein